MSLEKENTHGLMEGKTYICWQKEVCHLSKGGATHVFDFFTVVTMT